MNLKKIMLLLLTAIPYMFDAKRIMDAQIMHKKVINDQAWFKVRPLKEILKDYPSVSYQKCLEQVEYDFAQFPPSSLFPHKGVCDDCFILKIPNGMIYGNRGDVFIENNYIDEMVYKGLYGALFTVPKFKEEIVTKISGRVAVITQDLTKYYFHWMQDVLARLAMLEMEGIEYDYLYVDNSKPYMKETLELWGIDASKIIVPDPAKFFLQADEVILPSYTLNRNQGLLKYAGFHYNPVTMKYVSEKLIAAASKKNIDISKFSTRVFISRKDTANLRKITNEDAVFALFKPKGFVSYELSKMCVAEQIMLFQNAEIIIGEHGAGITNCLFCKPGTKVFEIFQALIDSGPWWITQVMNLDYTCIATVPVDPHYFARFGIDPQYYRRAWMTQREVSLESLKKVAASL